MSLELIDSRGRRRTSIQSDHTGLQSLQQPPNAIGIRGKRITGKAHAGVIRVPDSLVFGVEFVQRGDGREAFFLWDEHVLCYGC